MGTYGNVVAVVYALSALGLGIATVALLFGGMRADRDYRKFARRLMGIATGAIASGVVLLPVYNLLAGFAKGAEPLSPRALILGGLVPGLLGAILGFFGNRLLQENSERSVRLLILLNTAFGVYMLIGLASLFTTARAAKDLQSDVMYELTSLRGRVASLETSVKSADEAANMASTSLQKAEELIRGIESALGSLEAAGDSPSSHSYSSYATYNLRSESTKASEALRRVVGSLSASATCREPYSPCLDTLLSNLSEALRDAERIKITVNTISVNPAEQEQRALLGILPNLVFIMAAFLVITLSRESGEENAAEPPASTGRSASPPAR